MYETAFLYPSNGNRPYLRRRGWGGWEERRENVTFKLNSKMKNDFTEIIEAGMQTVLTCVEGRDTICIRIFGNEWNSCFNLKKSPSWRSWNSPPLSLKMLEKFRHQLPAFVQINLICNYLLIPWKKYVWATTLTSTAIIHVFIFCEITGLISSEVSFVFLIHITFNCYLRSLFWTSHQIWFRHAGAKRHDPSTNTPQSCRGITAKYEDISTACNFILCWPCILVITNLTHFFVYLFISCIYTFRASQRSSSGDRIALIHHLVWLVCVSDCLVCRSGGNCSPLLTGIPSSLGYYQELLHVTSHKVWKLTW